MMSNPTFEHLLNPVEKEALKEFVEALQEQYGALMHSVYLFGSKARGDSTPNSDVDILIVVDSDDWRLHKRIRYLVADICLQYDLNLSSRVWSVSHLQEMKEMQASIYHNIRQDGISLFEREPVAGS